MGIDGNKEIKCCVHTCKHNEADHCTLKSVTIGNTNPTEARAKRETECDSFMGIS